MALKDNLKHFRDVDEYSTTITKGDMDDNLDLLADNIDKKAFEYTSDETIIVATKDGKSFSTKVDGIVIGPGIEFDIDNYSFRAGYVGEEKEDRGYASVALGYYAQASGDYSFVSGFFSKGNGKSSISLGYYTQANNYAMAVGYYAQASGDYSSAFGYYTKSNGTCSFAGGNWGVSADGASSFAFGYNVQASEDYSVMFGLANKNIQKMSLAIGDNIVLKGTYVDKYSTADDTETAMLNPLKLKLKSAYLVRQKLIALKDDYATKWIAEIEHIIIVDGDGNVTINTTQNDIVKDDDNWSISFEAISDAENPLVNTKIKGVADTNINWGIFGEVNELLG